MDQLSRLPHTPGSEGLDGRRAVPADSDQGSVGQGLAQLARPNMFLGQRDRGTEGPQGRGVDQLPGRLAVVG